MRSASTQVLRLVLLAVVVGSCSGGPQSPTAPGNPTTPAPCAPLPGASCFGANGWIEYVAGDLPVVISVPHGGALAPASIPDRAFGTMDTDRNTIELGRAVADSLRVLTGRAPHLVISHLRRAKLDPNRGGGRSRAGPTGHDPGLDRVPRLHRSRERSQRRRLLRRPAWPAARLYYLTMRWANRLRTQPRFEMLSSFKPGETWGLATVGIEGLPPSRITSYLWEQHRILVAGISSGAYPGPQFDYQGVRVTPNVYTSIDEVDRFASAMEGLARS